MVVVVKKKKEVVKMSLDYNPRRHIFVIQHNGGSVRFDKEEINTLVKEVGKCKLYVAPKKPAQVESQKKSDPKPADPKTKKKSLLRR
jgi:hypothetical protein